MLDIGSVIRTGFRGDPQIAAEERRTKLGDMIGHRRMLLISTAITAVAIVVNALGNWVFVFGHLGAPALGLQGSALSSVITSVITLLAYVLAIRGDRRLRRYHLLGRFWRTEWPRFRELVRIGHEVSTLTPEGFWTFPLPTYPEIRLSIVSPPTIAAFIERETPDHIHIATEGPLGLLARLCAGIESWLAQEPENVAVGASAPRFFCA